MTAARPTIWSGDGLAISPDAAQVLRRIDDSDVVRVAADLDIWDAWPLQREDGMPHLFADGTTAWMALAAPRFDDPDVRHGHARIHLLSRDAARWRDLGPAMPNGFSPGSREWSGSAVVDAAGETLTLYFTATGARGEVSLTFRQRLFRATATIALAPEGLRLTCWRDLVEIVEPDPAWYMASDAGSGSVGTIKAFRDPAFYRDPTDGRRYLSFAGSAAASMSTFNGVVALIEDDGAGGWRLLPPIITADGVNNELERPHLVHHDGWHYLFWSTQAHVFAPGRPGPTGLYGMVAERLPGPWRALNGTGLVFATPPEAPAQSYSWLVLPDLTVASFVDDWAPQPGGPRRFGATFAPEVRITIEADRASLAPG